MPEYPKPRSMNFDLPDHEFYSNYVDATECKYESRGKKCTSHLESHPKKDDILTIKRGDLLKLIETLARENFKYSISDFDVTNEKNIYNQGVASLSGDMEKHIMKLRMVSVVDEED